MIGFFSDWAGGLLVRLAALACVPLALVAGWQALATADARREVARLEQRADTIAKALAAAEQRASTRAVQLERAREQCEADLAGVIQRSALEQARAREAGAAIARLSAQCVDRRDQRAVNQALRTIVGEAAP